MAGRFMTWRCPWRLKGDRSAAVFGGSFFARDLGELLHELPLLGGEARGDGDVDADKLVPHALAA